MIKCYKYSINSGFPSYVFFIKREYLLLKVYYTLTKGYDSSGCTGTVRRDNNGEFWLSELWYLYKVKMND